MHIPFSQIERKPPLFSYLLVACGVLTLLTLSSGMIRIREFRLPTPSVNLSHAQTERANLPVAIPVPVPPGGTDPSIINEVEEVANATTIPVPLANPVPVLPVP